MSEKYSDEQAEQNSTRVMGWWDEFIETAEFNRLTELEKSDARSILSSFTDFMYGYEGYTPEKWTDSALNSICIDIMPRKVMAEEEYFSAVAPVLTAFFEFLARKEYQKNAKRLADCARPLGKAIIEASQDSSNWGMGKSLMSMAQDAGVDFTDQGQMQQFIAAYNSRLASERLLPSHNPSRSPVEPYRNQSKVGRNDPCPCGSGKKFKKCCLGA